MADSQEATEKPIGWLLEIPEILWWVVVFSVSTPEAKLKKIKQPSDHTCLEKSLYI